MAVAFQDYYKILAVERDASQEEITKAYRKLARKLHPDVNKEADAEDRFKELNEAHEVLKNPETRKSYDALGANWKAGQQFTPPPNWEDMFGGNFRTQGGHTYSGSSQGPQFESGGQAHFSDFFNSLFGGFSGEAQQSARRGFFSGGQPAARRGSDIDTKLEVSLEEVYSQATKAIHFRVTEEQSDGQLVTSNKSYQVKVPPGISDGKTIRLAGQGGRGSRGGANGDLLLHLHYKKHPHFWTEEQTVISNLVVAPWEAALGARVEVPTLGGTVAMRIPQGAQSGQRLRLKERGMPITSTTRADMLVEIVVGIPKQLSTRERELFEQLRDESSYRPRS